MPASKLEKYALLAFTAICDLVLVAGAVTNQLSPHVAAEWGGILSTSGVLAHAGLDAVRQKNPGVVPDGLLNMDTDKVAEDIEEFVDPASLSDAQKAANPASQTPDPPPAATPEPAPAAPAVPSAEEKLRAQLVRIGQTPEA